MADGIMVDGRLPAVIRHSLATLLATTALGVVAAHAVDGTWTGATTDWTASTNWSTLTVPDGTATVGNTGSAAVDNNNGIVAIGTLLFNGTAQAYSVTVGKPFTVNGTGIINNSGNTQDFAVTSGNNLVFQQSSTASGGTGAVTITTNNLGTTSFTGTSSGGAARFITAAGGIVDFSGLTNGGTTAGSIEGGGNYVFGANTLTTGSLNTSTQVDGVISASAAA